MVMGAAAGAVLGAVEVAGAGVLGEVDAVDVVDVMGVGLGGVVWWARLALAAAWVLAWLHRRLSLLSALRWLAWLR